MSDEELRALERIAATGGIEEKVRLAQARCQMGQHSWSEWASRSTGPWAIGIHWKEGHRCTSCAERRSRMSAS